MLRADLHVHTYFSDGLLSPAEVAAEAKSNGLDAVAVTDHDNLFAYPEFYLECAARGIKAVQGIEVSAYIGDTKIHTLGYNFDKDKPAFKDFMKKLYEGSLNRSGEMIARLNKNGVSISMEEVIASKAVKETPVHVMHVARACAEKGYCNKNPFTFFKEYLAYGKCAYSGICRPSPEEAVEVITACGGVASLAHPGRIELPQDELIKLIKKLKACGLYGIEAVYSAHTSNETAYYKETAKAFGLEVTGGSDTHTKGGNRRIGTPEFYIGEALAKVLGI